jgi:uncharacterized protein YkuJ
MRKNLLFASVFMLVTLCAFAQNKTRHPHFDWESNYLHERNKPSARQGNPANFRSVAVMQRLDSMVLAGSQRQVFEYDNNGNPMSAIFYTWENNAWKESLRNEYEYDSNGNEIMFAQYVSGIGWSKRECEFDSNGNVSMQISYKWGDNNWEKDRKIEREYDSNGNVSMQTEYYWTLTNNSWAIDTKIEFQYDGNDDRTAMIYHIWQGSSMWFKYEFKTEYTYTGNTQTRIEYSRYGGSDWTPDNKIELVYDGFARLIANIQYYWNSDTGTFLGIVKWEYAYDNTGNETMRVLYQWDSINSSWRGASKEEFEFDLSVPFSEIISLFEKDRFFNKPTSRKSYSWFGDAWGTTGFTWTLYYSEVQTSVPNISANYFTIFPNPVVENFTISGITENTLVSITDLNGRIVLQQMVLPNESVSVGNLLAGIYFVRVNGNVAKMVKQ